MLIRSRQRAVPSGAPAVLFTALLSLALLSAPAQTAPRKIILDEDGSGPGGTNQMAILLLLQSPETQVLGITMVSGDAWEPEEVAHTLRTLELIHRTDVPVIPGAIYPLLRTEQETRLERPLVGSQSWYGAWGDLSGETANSSYHAPEVIPALPEGAPTTRPAPEDAAHFLVRQVRAYPHQVWIYAGGPLTNIALALALEPHLAELSAGIAIMGGSLAPRTKDPDIATHPRHEFNFWFDPEAAHIVLRAPWPHIDLTPVDISIQVRLTPEIVRAIARSPQPAAEYVARYARTPDYMWDELAAAAWLNPALITAGKTLYLDVDLTRGPSYGDTLSWTEADKPATLLHPVHVHTEVDPAAFYDFFSKTLEAPPVRADERR